MKLSDMAPHCTRLRSAFLSSYIVAMGIIVTTLVGQFVVPEEIGEHYPHNFNYIINHPKMCNSSHDIQLLIMVYSACPNEKSRLSVRYTWGSLVKRRDVRLLFVLGSPSEEQVQQQIFAEDRTFGDILQEDFMDTYYNLTLKTIMMVKWVTTYCPKARYVLKIDDDCFMNPDKLFAFLAKNLTEVAIFGRVWRKVPPYRNKDHKWYMSRAMYPKSLYPDFASGPSYLLTRKAVPLLYDAALTTKSIYLEDVYLNGLCAEKAKIPRVHNSGLFMPSTEVHSVATVRTKVLTSHMFPSNQLLLLWWLLYDSRGKKLDSVLKSYGDKALEKKT